MDKKIIKTDNAPPAVGKYSQGVMANGILFVSGQVPLNPADGKLVEGIEAQARRSMENVKGIVEEAGLEMSNIVKTTILLADINDFSVVNEIYSGYFDEDPPARACFAVKDIPKGAMIEIEAIAVK